MLKSIFLNPSSVKYRAFFDLMKFRLSIFISISGCFGFLYASKQSIDWGKFIFFTIGGFFITIAANTINQLIESDLDALMKRTSSRPLPSQRLTQNEAIAFTLISGMIGFGILISKVNVMSAFLTFTSMLLYGFMYTPMKKISPFAVFIGAIPGALPPLIGYSAAVDMIKFEAILLFAIQFIWQFPHFWAIAWILDEDYQKAGFRLLPSSKGKDQHSAFQILIYTIFVLPITILPYLFGFTGIWSAISSILLALVFIYIVIIFYKRPSDDFAKKIMLFSIIYLPIIQFILYLDKN